MVYQLDHAQMATTAYTAQHNQITKTTAKSEEIPTGFRVVSSKLFSQFQQQLYMQLELKKFQY